MYSIDSIPMTVYGLHIIRQDGSVHLSERKEQFYTSYGVQGHQITKRKGNVLELNGFLLANGLSDFQGKVSALQTALKAPGLRNIVIEDDSTTLKCFSKEGFKISGLRLSDNMAFAKTEIKLELVSVEIENTTPISNPFTRVFNHVFGGGGETVPEPEPGIFNSAFSAQFN